MRTHLRSCSRKLGDHCKHWLHNNQLFSGYSMFLTITVPFQYRFTLGVIKYGHALSTNKVNPHQDMCRKRRGRIPNPQHIRLENSFDLLQAVNAHKRAIEAQAEADAVGVRLAEARERCRQILIARRVTEMALKRARKAASERAATNQVCFGISGFVYGFV